MTDDNEDRFQVRRKPGGLIRVVDWELDEVEVYDMEVQDVSIRLPLQTDADAGGDTAADGEGSSPREPDTGRTSAAASQPEPAASSDSSENPSSGFSPKAVEQWQNELLASYPENYGNKAVEFVEQCHPDHLVLDHGQHCVCCGRDEDDVQLISNPDIPRVLCMSCYTWGVLKVKERALVRVNRVDTLVTEVLDGLHEEYGNRIQDLRCGDCPDDRNECRDCKQAERLHRMLLDFYTDARERLRNHLTAED